MYKILSLDGGGIRGLITARLLQRLNEHPDIAGWLNDVDQFVGTSTGGIIALGLANGLAPEELYELYKEKGKAIFDDSIWDNIRDLGKTIGADYSNKNLKAELKRFFGTTTLSDIKKKVVIPTFDLDNEDPDQTKHSWKPKIFHNFKGKDSDGKYLAADVALYTASAPTYFPSADGYIDGGVFANNPSIVGLAQAISQANIKTERVKLDQIVLLSVGTGVNLHFIKKKNLDWGYAQWIGSLIDIMMDGVNGISDYQARQLLDDQYHRLQIVFDPKTIIKMDDADEANMKRMDEISSNYDLKKTVAWIRKTWV